MPAPEETALETWRSFVRAKAEIGRAMHRKLGEYGLTGAQLGILRVLADSGGAGVQLNEISQRLCVTSANVTGLLDRLEEVGHLARVPHPDDRRITLAVLTPEGQELYEKVYPSHVARVKQLVSALTTGEQVLLADLLGRLADQASKMDR